MNTKISANEMTKQEFIQGVGSIARDIMRNQPSKRHEAEQRSVDAGRIGAFMAAAFKLSPVALNAIVDIQGDEKAMPMGGDDLTEILDGFSHSERPSIWNWCAA